MRGDAKHQTFTRYAKRTNNFKNICKTLSERHQHEMASTLRINTFSDQIKTSKKAIKLTNSNGNFIEEIKDHANLFSQHFKVMRNAVIRTRLIANSFYFEKDFFIITANQIHQIDAILEYNNSFIFLCTHFRAVKFHKFANCIEVRKSSDISLIKFNDLECKRSYERNFFKGIIQIIADNLDMLPIYEKLII